MKSMPRSDGSEYTNCQDLHMQQLKKGGDQRIWDESMNEENKNSTKIKEPAHVVTEIRGKANAYLGF